MQSRVMVVDDDPVSRAILAKTLAPRFEVVVAGGGKEALERLDQGGVDLLIADLHMPEVSGLDLARKVKASAGERFVPVIVVTADQQERALGEAFASGADDFLTKPIRVSVVRAKVDALLRVSELFLTVTKQRDELAFLTARASQDYAVARRVFGDIQRRASLDLPSLEYRLQPLGLFNGDLLMAAECPGGRVRVMVGDFAGHGLSAAVGAMPAADVFYSEAGRTDHLGSLIRQLNARIHRTLPRDLFLAACVIEVDLAAERLIAWNGGLPEAVVIAPDGAVKARIPSTHLPLGVLPGEGIEPAPVEVAFPRGARLFVYTDGLVEARKDGGEMFGQERLEQALARAGSDAGWAARTAAEVAGFTEDAELKDDVTFLGLAHSDALRAALTREVAAPVSRASLRLHLDPESLAKDDPVKIATFLFENDPALRPKAVELDTVLRELLSNAIEHGILGLDSRLKEQPGGYEEYYRRRRAGLAALKDGWVRITLEIIRLAGEQAAVLTVEDSGPGFSRRTSLPPQPDTSTPHNRGIVLVKSLCRRLRFLEGGRVAEATVLLQGT